MVTLMRDMELEIIPESVKKVARFQEVNLPPKHLTLVVLRVAANLICIYFEPQGLFAKPLHQATKLSIFEIF